MNETEININMGNEYKVNNCKFIRFDLSTIVCMMIVYTVLSSF